MRHRFLNDVISIIAFREARLAQALSLGPGFWSLGLGFSFLGLGFWSLGFGFSYLGLGLWALVFVFWLWFLVFGHLFLVFGPWFFVFGLLFLALSPLSLALGLGLWNLRHRFLNGVISILSGLKEARFSQPLSLGLDLWSSCVDFWSLGLGFWSLALWCISLHFSLL